MKSLLALIATFGFYAGAEAFPQMICQVEYQGACTEEKARISIRITKMEGQERNHIHVGYDLPQQCFSQALRGTLVGTLQNEVDGKGKVHIDPGSIEKFKANNPGGPTYFTIAGLETFLELGQDKVTLTSYYGLTLTKEGTIAPQLANVREYPCRLQ